jgi:hypothetical protein
MFFEVYIENIGLEPQSATSNTWILEVCIDNIRPSPERATGSFSNSLLATGNRQIFEDF